MSAELDVDAPEAQLAPRPGHTEPDWDTEDAERWLRALITEVRWLRDRVQELELQRDVARTLHGSWRQRAERVEAAAQPLARCQTPICRCDHPIFRHEAGDCDECDCTLSRVGAAATAHDCGACDGCRLVVALADAPADYCACPDMPSHDSGFCPQCGRRERQADAPAPGPSLEARELLADLKARMDPGEYAELCRKHGDDVPGEEEW